MAQHNANADEGTFASMFEASLSGMERFRPGQMVETRIVSIAKDAVFLQLGGKSEGVLDRAELTDKDGKLTAAVGDPIRAFFVGDKGGEKRFTTKIAGDDAIPALLEEAFKNKVPVEGLVEREIKGGFEVKIGGTRAFCPFSQMGGRRGEAPATYLGQNLTFIIQEFKDRGRSILVSNRAIHEAARLERLEALKASLHEGMRIKGTIKSLQSYGAFVDLGGVQALLPVSEIGRERVEDIASVLAVGQEVEAEVIRLDWANERISLSMKSLLADPWDQAAEKYPKNSKHTGQVVRVADFGAFVALEPGIDGLVHVSEFREGGKYGNSGVPVKKGQTLSVQVLNVDAAARRISLKPASSVEEDETTRQYLDGGPDTDTYNPFAALLKKK